MSDTQNTKQALERAVKVVTLSPSRGQRVYTNVASISSGTYCQIKEKDHVLTADVSPSMGGEGRGPSPSMILRSAMTSCVAIGIKMWAAREDITVDGVEVTLETDVDAQGQLGVDDRIAPGFEGLRLGITVATTADEQIMKKIIEKSLKYSPLMDVFSNSHTIATKMNIVDHDFEQSKREACHG